MTEDPRISEIRAVLEKYEALGAPFARGGLRKIGAIIDRKSPAPRALGPEHEYALSVARGAVLKAARKFVTAADMYRKRDLLHSVREMADSERACVKVASFLADEIANARAERKDGAA